MKNCLKTLFRAFVNFTYCDMTVRKWQQIFLSKVYLFWLGIFQTSFVITQKPLSFPQPGNSPSMPKFQ